VIAHADHDDRRLLGLERQHRQPPQAGVPEQAPVDQHHVRRQHPELPNGRRQVGGNTDGLEPRLGLEQGPQRRSRRAPV